jgi:hypothetical protein
METANSMINQTVKECVEQFRVGLEQLGISEREIDQELVIVRTKLKEEAKIIFKKALEETAKHHAEFWIGKVAGSKIQIEKALQSLQMLGKAINAKELQSEIIKQIECGLGDVLLLADEQSNFTPY